MDKMNDDELRFVISHEIGHLADVDALDKLRMAYAAAAGRQGAGAIGSTRDPAPASAAGQFSRLDNKGLFISLLGANSQKERGYVFNNGFSQRPQD